MGRLVIDSDTGDSAKLVDDTNILVVTAEGSINRFFKSTDYFAIDNTALNADITVDGFVIATYNGLEFAFGVALYNRADGATISIGKTGILVGDRAITSTGADANITNAGRLQGRIPDAVFISGADSVLHNTGVIYGIAGVTCSGVDASITNDVGGRIVASVISDDGQRSSSVHFTLGAGFHDALTNYGTLLGNVLCGAADDTIINSGKIQEGNVTLGSGDDMLNTRGGTVSGAISGGDGNDTLITDNSSYQMIELENEGFDQVKSTASYTLSANVEQLTLIGKSNVNGTGNNDASNFLYGNNGNNILNGLDGENEIFGYGGRDTLIGGTGTDVFGFGKGYGRDTISNYVDEQDLIAMEKFNGVASFDQIRSHIAQHGNDVWINMGHGDLLIIKGADAGSLEETDFSINYYG